MLPSPDEKPFMKHSVIVPGFKFSGISSGIKKTKKKDLALIYSENTAAIAGIFTANKIKAAPVKLDITRIRRSGKARAVIINSGNANACTGRRGIKDAHDIAQITARELRSAPHLVYVASTGLIGRPLPLIKIKKAIPESVRKLSSRSIRHAASAIMTTDTFTKIDVKKILISGKTGTIAGIAKGAGMMCPHLATMLCFIVTDIAVERRALNAALREAAEKSFNSLTIDNDMSTNDTVLLLSNGFLKNKPITKNSFFYKKFENALAEVSYNLSKMIAMDAEGTTKLVKVRVRRAKTTSDAEKASRAIASSLLVKTALYGENPNWGRIMAAIGYSGAHIQEDKIAIYINNFKVVNKGTGVRKTPKHLFQKNEIVITADLGIGEKEADMLTCDLSEKYVKINAGYMT